VSTAPVSYYVYYRVAAAHAGDARPAIASMLASLERRTGVAGRLLRREDEPLLWMEVYENVRDTAEFDAALAALIETQGFGAWLAPGSHRHIERFIAVS